MIKASNFGVVKRFRQRIIRRSDPARGMSTDRSRRPLDLDDIADQRLSNHMDDSSREVVW